VAQRARRCLCGRARRLVGRGRRRLQTWAPGSEGHTTTLQLDRRRRSCARRPGDAAAAPLFALLPLQLFRFFNDSEKRKRAMQAKKLTLLQTVAAAGVFSAVSCWYGFMFGRESARRELGGIIDELRKSTTTSTTSSEPDANSKP